MHRPPRVAAGREKKNVTYEVVAGGLTAILAIVFSFVTWGHLSHDDVLVGGITLHRDHFTGHALLATAILQVVLMLVLVAMLLTHELRETWYYLVFGGPFVNAVVSWHVDFTAVVPLMLWFTMDKTGHPVTFKLMTTAMTFSLLFAGFVREQLYLNKAEYFAQR